MIAALQLSLRASLAAGVSLAVANALGLAFPIYAMIAAVIVTDLDPARTRRQALPRITGTLIGAAVGAVACAWLPTAPWSIALGIGVTMLACQLARMHDATKLAGYVAGIVLLQHSEQPWLYALDRLVETAIGLGIAVAVSFVPKLLREDAPGAAADG